MTTSTVSLENFPTAGAISPTDIVYIAQGGYERQATMSQLQAALAPTELSEIKVAGVDFVAGTSTSLTTANIYSSAASLKVFFDTWYQGPDAIASYAGNTLTFTSAIPVGTQRVYLFGPTPAMIGTPGDSTVTTAKLAPGSVVDSKLAWLNILARFTPSMFALRSLSSGIYNFAYVAGYYNVGDIGGGQYWMNSGDTTSGAFGVGSISGTTLTISAITNGSYNVGQQVNGAGVANGTYITAIGTGTGGTGTYTVNVSQTVGSTVIVADNGGSIVVAFDGARWYLNGPADWYIEQFGARGDGTIDDALPTQSAINALPARGGTVRMFGKQYYWWRQVVIGNGNSGSTQSTQNGARLIGAGGGFGTASPPPTNIMAMASMSGAMLSVQGATTDNYLEGFKLYANSLAQGCLYLTAASGTQIRNVTGNQYLSFGMWWHGGSSPTGNYNINNQINNCFFASTVNNHSGLVMDGIASVSNDTWLTSFNDVRFDTTSATGSNAAYLAFVDSITITRCHFVGNNTSGVGLSGCYGVYFNAVGNNGFPSGINFQFCSVLTTFVNESTDTMRKCTFEGYGTYDNETIPTSPRLIGYTDQGVRFNGWGS